VGVVEDAYLSELQAEGAGNACAGLARSRPGGHHIGYLQQTLTPACALGISRCSLAAGDPFAESQRVLAPAPGPAVQLGGLQATAPLYAHSGAHKRVYANAKRLAA